MSGPSGGAPADDDPEAAFGLLGNETRIAILRALAGPAASLSFSELRARAEVTDSGRFNYHLQALTGRFVDHMSDGSYELTYAGKRAVGAIYAGTYTQRGAPRRFDIDSACTRCGTGLRATYERERCTISCPACEDRISTFGFPPGAFENRSTSELARAFDTWIRSFLSASFGGFCLSCAGRMTGTLTDTGDYFPEYEVGTMHVCERCSNTTVNSIGAYLVFQPAVVAFHHDHGMDLTTTPIWEIPWLRDEETTVCARDPLRTRSVVELADDRLELAVDQDLSVTIPER